MRPPSSDQSDAPESVYAELWRILEDEAERQEREVEDGYDVALVAGDDP